MFNRFNPDTDWETCSVVSDRALKGGSSHGNDYSWETHMLLVRPHSSQAVAVIEGEIHAWLLSRHEDRDKNLMSADQSNIRVAATLTKAILALPYLENEKPGDSPAIPRHWEIVSPTQYDAANVNKQKQKPQSNPPHTFSINNTLQTGKGEERSHGDANRPWYRTVIRLSQANPYLNSPLIPLHTARFPDGPWASWPASNSLRRVCWKQRWRIKYHVLRRGTEGEKKIIPCFPSK